LKKSSRGYWRRWEAEEMRTGVAMK